MYELPTKMERSFRSLVAKHGLSDHFDQLRREVLPGFSIRAGKGSTKVGKSRFGGLPDVPREFRWPIVKEGHLLFVAQINLSDLPKFVDPLPRNGYLLFFSDSYGINSKVLWYPACPRTLVMAAEPDPAEFVETHSWGSLKIGPIFQAVPIRFEKSIFIPPVHPLRCDDEDLWERRYELKCALANSDSRLLGYSYYEPGEGGLDGGFDRWETLFQIVSFEPCRDMLWEDNGKLAYFVRKGCVRKNAFGRVTSCIVGAG